MGGISKEDEGRDVRFKSGLSRDKLGDGGGRKFCGGRGAVKGVVYDARVEVKIM